MSLAQLGTGVQSCLTLKWSVPKGPSGGTTPSISVWVSVPTRNGWYVQRDTDKPSTKGFFTEVWEGLRESTRGLTLRKPLQPLDLKGKRRELLPWDGAALLEPQPWGTAQPLPGRDPDDTYSNLDPARASPWPKRAVSQKESHLSDFTEFSPHRSAFQ